MNRFRVKHTSVQEKPTAYEKYHDKVSALWHNIAVHFKDYDEKLMFEGFNEMLDGEGHWGGAGSPEEYKAHNDFNQLFADTVRATCGNNAQRNLMVQIYSGACGDGAFENFVLPTDSTKGHLIIQVINAIGVEYHYKGELSHSDEELEYFRQEVTDLGITYMNKPVKHIKSTYKKANEKKTYEACFVGFEFDDTSNGVPSGRGLMGFKIYSNKKEISVSYIKDIFCGLFYPER